VTEGEDKPLKYPTIFNSADAAVITKCDLAAAVEFDELTAVANIRAVRPEMPVFLVSAKSGEGMDNYLQFIIQRMHRKQSDVGDTSPAEVTLNRI